jgi:hypothetical protein
MADAAGPCRQRHRQDRLAGPQEAFGRLAGVARRDGDNPVLHGLDKSDRDASLSEKSRTTSGVRIDKA